MGVTYIAWVKRVSPTWSQDNKHEFKTIFNIIQTL